jgi:4,5-DOPA dioxygenase extradiol
MDWGLDHGTWSVLRHIYPEAIFLWVQLSLNRNLNIRHYSLANELQHYATKEFLLWEVET